MSSHDWSVIYNQHAEAYDRLVRCEDYEGHLLPALRQIAPLENARVVEFGAGAGRITAQLAPLVQGIWAFDFTPAMLQIASRKRQQAERQNWLTGLADNRAIPVASGCADISIEGWSFLQMMVWLQERWRSEVGRAVDEMLRILRPGGVAPIFGEEMLDHLSITTSGVVLPECTGIWWRKK